ncbi:unnamed protein product [Musa acuminata subsp. malaccensis]|uniref:(wild Malaysian banana) hypothetical protein n=1 Tax=Musa acuminata subsp. malaccensis TaxID=214687 RepID=A0A804JPP3_MUSAM|nr:unnamed protein product [Musa acuminata subsp. malaccensis]
MMLAICWTSSATKFILLLSDEEMRSRCFKIWICVSRICKLREVRH